MAFESLNNDAFAVKVSLGNELRRLSFVGTSFVAMRDMIGNMFAIPADRVAIKYLDDEGDKISVSSDAELLEAIRVSKDEKKTLRLFVEVKDVVPIVDLVGEKQEKQPNPVDPQQQPFPHYYPSFGPYHQFPPHHHSFHGPSPFLAGGRVPQGFGHRAFSCPRFEPVNPSFPTPVSNNNNETSADVPSFRPYGGSFAHGCAPFPTEQQQVPFPFVHPHMQHHLMKKMMKDQHKEFKKECKDAKKEGKKDAKKDKSEWREARCAMWTEVKAKREAFHERKAALKNTIKEMNEKATTKEEKQAVKQLREQLKLELDALKKEIHDMKKVHIKPDHLTARHVADVSIPDDTELPPDTAVTKTWRISNPGLKEWPVGCALIFISHRGDILDGPERVVLDKPVPPQQEVEVSVPFITPSEPGRYIGFYRMSDPEGAKFGQRLWVSFVVKKETNATGVVAVKKEADATANTDMVE